LNDVPRQVLLQIVRQFGRDVLYDARRCRALMLDLCGGHKAEVNLLEMALREEVIRHYIASVPHVPRALVVARLVQRLRDGYYVPEEAARWAVTACIDAYEGLTVASESGAETRTLISEVPAQVFTRQWLDPDNSWVEQGATPGSISVAGDVESRIVTRTDNEGLRRLASDLASFGGSIQHLDLSYAALSGEALRPLESLGGLLTLDLSRTQLDDGALASVARQDQLVELNLWGCSRITDGGLPHLAALSRLERLELGQCVSVTNAGVAVLTALPRLIALGLSGTGISDDGLALLRGAPALRRLDLGHTGIVGSGLAALAELKGLWSLSLYGCVHLRPHMLASLRSLRALSSLNLGRCGLLSDRSMVYLRPLRTLSELSLEGLAVGDPGMIYLTELVGLVLLDLSWTRVGDAGVARLSALRGLRTLALAGTLLTDAGLQSLAALPGLADLDISDTHVTDAGLRAVGMLDSLESLNLEGTEIHDAGLVHLGELQQLRRLYLGRTQVTDKGLGLLQRVSGVTHVDLALCPKVTEEGIRGLQEAGVTVSH